MKRKAISRGGMSLLELIIATSMLAMVLSSVTLVLRTGRLAWEAHEGDFVRLEAAHATLRHIVRQTRQAKAVTSLSAAADTSGMISLAMANGDVFVWDHDASTQRVNCGVGSANQLLATGITGLTIVGYKADASTETTNAADVQCLKITVTVTLPRETNATRNVTSWAWVRTW